LLFYNDILFGAFMKPPVPKNLYRRAQSKKKRGKRESIFADFILTGNRAHVCIVQADTKADPVPQIAIIAPTTSIIPSIIPHFLSRATFAAIGPIMHIINAENEPKKAIIASNSGTAMDTPTEAKVTIIRCAFPKTTFVDQGREVDIFTAMSSGEATADSIPRSTSRTAFS